MTDYKRRHLDNAVAAVQQRYGPQALRHGDPLYSIQAVPHISTGFPALDAITGCMGAPAGALTLFSGRTTSGKVTVAYKLLANAQRTIYGQIAYTVALIDLSRTADPDYLARCGVDLQYLLVARPERAEQSIAVLGDLLQLQRPRAVVVDGLTQIAADRTALRLLNEALGKLVQLARTTGCALVFLDDPKPPWQRWLNLDGSRAVRWRAALHVEMQRERWLRHDNELAGYQAQARLLKSRWVHAIRSAPIEIVFNGTVRARETW